MADLTARSLLLAQLDKADVRAVTLQQVLAGRRGVVTDVSGADEPVALVPDDHVVPGQLYDASDDGAHFAVPAYALEVVDGRYTSSLRWRHPEDDQQGPIAFLTLKFSVAVPPDAREIAHQATVRLTHAVAVSDAAGEAAVLATELGALLRTSPTTAEVRFGMTAKDEFDALWLAITDASRPATVELSAGVTVGRRVWRRKWSPVVRELTPVVPKSELLVDPQQPDPHPEWGRLRVLDGTVSRQIALTQLQQGAALRVADLTVAKQPVLDQAVGPVVAKQALPLAERARSLGRRVDPGGDVPGVERLPTEPPSGRLPTEPPSGRLPLWPIEPTPTLLRLTLPFSTTVGPFAFPVDTNAYMFDVPGDLRPQTTRLLLRHEFDPGGDRPRLVYYEDTAFPDRYYYEPPQFRVPRDQTEPYLPRMAIAFTDVVVTDTNGTPGVRYTARLRYSAAPDLDSVVLTALRRELAARPGAGAPDLTALLPTQATLQLQLPDDAAGGQLTTVTHTLASDAFDDGFSDEIELSVTEFAAAMTMLQTDALRGTIVADLLGAGHTEIPVELSLRDTPGVPLHRAYRGPVDGAGTVRVSVTNPLESPVQILELFGIHAAAGITAFPLSNPGLRIPPSGSADLDYRLTPDGSSVDDLAPAVHAVVEADLRALLPKIMVNSGYADQTFALTVRTDPTLLANPTAQGPLLALLVQFEGDVEIILDASTPSRDTAIRMPILPWLLKDADAERYRYRVVNLHGTAEAPQQGAISDWREGLGGGTLMVAPAGG